MNSDPSSPPSTLPLTLNREDESIPLLQFNHLKIGSRSWGSNEPLRTSGSSLACVGSADVVLSALIEPRLISQGSIELMGVTPQSLLASHQTGFVPIRLPLPPETRVHEALLLSARLVDLTRDDVDEALARTQIEELGKMRLGKLTRLQERLVGLAHGLTGSPRLLLLEDIYADLDESEATLIELILEQELHDTKWIAAVDPSTTPARSLMMRADEILQATETEFLPPLSPRLLEPHAFWVICKEPTTDFAALLRQEGAQVTQTPHPSVVFVRNLTGRAIFEVAHRANNSIFELAPAQGGGLDLSRAKPSA